MAGGIIQSYDQLDDAQRQKVAQFAAGIAGGNANVSRALQALSANPAYALQMMQRVGIDIGQPDSSTSNSGREINWSDAINASMRDGGADIAPEQAQSAPMPPRRPRRPKDAGANVPVQAAGGPGDMPPLARGNPSNVVVEEAPDDGSSINRNIMNALAAAAAAAAGYGAYRGMRGRGQPTMQLPPEAGGPQQALPNRMQMVEGPQDPRLLNGPAPKLMPPGTEDVVDAEYRDVTPRNVEQEERKQLPKPKSDSEKTLDKSVEDDEPKKANRRERAAKAVRESTRKVKLKK